MNKQLSDFYSQHGDQAKVAKEILDESSSTPMSPKLDVSGRYLMRVDTRTYLDKDTKEIRYSPEITVSKTKGSLILTISLVVVDGTNLVPKGSYIITTLVLMPKPGASEEKFINTMRMLKPRLVALLGTEDIDIGDGEWVEENLLPKFEGQKLLRDHKMKNLVMVNVEDDVYNDSPTLKVTSIVAAKPGDHSESNVATPNIPVPTDTDIDDDSASNYVSVNPDSINDDEDDDSYDIVEPN